MYETFEEGRDSIKRALNKCEFSAAFNKIEEILEYLKKSISELQEYQYRIGSKSEKSAKV